MGRVLVIGAGKGGTTVIKRLLTFNWVQIVGVVDYDPNAPGLLLARENGLPVFTDTPSQVLKLMDVDLVFDLTGDPRMEKELMNFPNRAFDLAMGEATHLLWNVIQELEKQEGQIKHQLGEQQLLSEIGLMLSRSNTPDQVFEAIVNGVIKMTGMPAGSLSVLNKERQELYLVSAKGFSCEFYRESSYPVRPGGLTEYILSHNEPILIPDISDHPSFNNPIILREGVRSLIAVPLIAEEGPIGILYCNDFKPRVFDPTMLEPLRALATQAVIAIQKQQAFEQIKNLSIHDPLTGLYNRRYLNKVLTTEMKRAYRLQHPLSVILLDIDHFKRINDRFGHVTGDQVLQGLARLFETVIREYDIFTRYGGEEFLVMTSESNEQETFALAERLREVVASAKLSSEKISLTCSFGVSTLWWNKGPLPSMETFVDRADKALYQAKAEGRNRTKIFGIEGDTQASNAQPLPAVPKRRRRRKP